MLINNFSDRLLRDITPNCIYLWGKGKIVSVVIFFFTNKAVARASHACRIIVGSNTDYLFTSCFESAEICFLPTGRGAVVSCFPGFPLWTGEKERHLPRRSSAGLHGSAASQQQPQPTLRAPQAAACSRCRSTGQ